MVENNNPFKLFNLDFSMRNTIRNSLVSAGLAGILSLTGCRTPTTRVEFNVRGNPSIEHKKEVYASSSSYTFNKSQLKFKANNYFEVPVKEERLDSIQEYDVKTTPIENVFYTAEKVPANPLEIAITYPIACCLFVGIPLIVDPIAFLTGHQEKSLLYDMSKNSKGNIVPGTEKVRKVFVGNDRSTINLKNYAQPSINPAIGIKVEASSDKLIFENVGKRAYLTTDDKGMIRTKISPLEGFLSESEAREKVFRILEETYTPTALKEFASKISPSEKIVAPIKLTTQNDEMKFNVPVYVSIDPRPAMNAEIKKSLESYLSGKFPMKEIPLELVTKGTDWPISDAVVTTTWKSGPTEEKVLQEEIRYLNKFLLHEPDMAELVIEPSKYIRTFPERFVLNESTKAKINQDCVFTLKVIHPKHLTVSEDISVNDTKGKIIRMPEKPIPQENRETSKDANKGSVSELER